LSSSCETAHWQYCSLTVAFDLVSHSLLPLKRIYSLCYLSKLKIYYRLGGLRAKDLVFLSDCTMLALYSGGFCLSACLLKFLSLGISLCSDDANFTAKANAFALPTTERLGRQTVACDYMCTYCHTHTHSGHLKYALKLHYVSDRDPDGIHKFHALYHIVKGSKQANNISLVLQQSNWTDVFPMRHFLSHIEKNNFPSKSFCL